MLRVQSSLDTVKLKDMAKLRAQLDSNMANLQADRETRRSEYARDHILYRDSLDRPDRTRQPIDPNDDIKLLALNSLMQQEPEKALPVLRTFIFSDKPIELRRRALFVLGQSKAPGAQELLSEIATKSSDPELQRAAVQTFATTQGKGATPKLLEFYRNSTDHNVKRAALNGLFIAGDASGLVDLAREEKNLDLKREIVSQLALMHDPAATAYMEELLK